MKYGKKKGFGQIIFWGIAAIAAGYAVWRLFGTKIKALFAKKA